MGERVLEGGEGGGWWRVGKEEVGGGWGGRRLVEGGRGKGGEGARD